MFFFWPGDAFSIQLPITTADVSNMACDCMMDDGKTATWMASCSASVSSNVGTFTVKISQPGGYCSSLRIVLPLETVFTSLPAAFIEYLTISPVARPIYTNNPQSMKLLTIPSLSDTQLLSVLHNNIKVFSTLVAGIDSTNSTGTFFTFSDDYIQKLVQASSLIDNQNYMIDLALFDALVSFPITQPWILYKRPNITSVTPTLARKNQNVLFSVSTNPSTVGGDFTTNTGVSRIATIADGSDSVAGTLISSKTIQVTQQVKSDINTFYVSLDGNQYDAQVSGSVEGFDFPAAGVGLSYTTPIDGIDAATGCSIFAFNNLTFVADSIVKQPNNWGAISLRIRDEGFSRTGPCTWIKSSDGTKVTGFNCPCPELWDLNVGLPQTFTYELQFNGQDWYSSTSFTGAPQINYYNPIAFSVSQNGKLYNKPSTAFTITGLKNRYDNTRFTYTIKATQGTRSVTVSSTTDTSPVCTPLNGDGFSCPSIPLLDFSNSRADTVTLCGCNWYQRFDYDNENSTQPLPMPNQCSPDFVCAVNFVVSVNRAVTPVVTTAVDYSAAAPYYIYGPIDCGDPRNTSNRVTPKNIQVGKGGDIHIYAIQGKFLNSPLLKFKLDPFGDSYMPNTPTSSGSITGPLKYVSDKHAYFTISNTLTQQQVAMNLSISMNDGADWDRLSAQVVRFYDPYQINYNYIIGNQGKINITLPSDVLITIIGSNFFPSDNIWIQFDRKFVSLKSNCTFVNSTSIICLTPNMLATGVFLPSTFAVSISYDSLSDFIPTGMDLQFEESIQPVIVQIVPPMGPINSEQNLVSKASPDGRYTISIKGLTNQVTGCGFAYPYNYTGALDPSLTSYSITQSNNQQVDCLIPIPNLMKHATANGITFPATYAVYLLTAIESQKSDPFPFKFYLNPNLTGIYPANVPAFGGDSVVITGVNLGEANDYTVGFKIVDTQSTSNCVALNSTAIRCITPPHPDGKNLQVSITYNQYQFTAMPSSVAFTVDACAVGYSATDFTKKCVQCEAGRYKPLQGFFDCIDCEQGRYQSQPAQQLCIGCPRFTTTPNTRSTNITQCDCQPGYFRANNTFPGVDCNACPNGGNCTGLGSSPKPQPGWWYNTGTSRPNDGYYIFENCEPHAARCTGDLSVNGGCATGRNGVLCADCQSGWFKSGEECKMCTDDVRLRFIIVVLVIVALVIVFFKFAQLKVAYLSSISIAVSYFQIIAVFSLYDFKWPQSLKNAIQVLQFINLNLDIVVPECISIVTYGLKWGVTVSLPAIFGACLIAAFSLELARSIIVTWTGPLLKPYIMNWYRIDHRNFLTKFCTEQRRDIALFLCSPKSGPEMKEFSDMCIHTFMIIISFSYVFVITKASEIFNCQWVPESGINIMVADTTVTCYQGVWWAYFPFSIGLIIAFGLGTIVLFLYISLNRKRIVKDKVFNDRFRFLFVRFRNERLFWEAVIVIRKLLISVAIIFFAGYPMLVILFCMFVIFCSFILQTHHVPFRRVFHNIMEYVQLLATEFLLFAALLFYVDAFPDEWNKDALGYITIVVVVFCTFIILCLILLDVMSQIRRSWKKGHEKRIKGGVAVNAVPAEDGDVELPEVVVSPRKDEPSSYEVMNSPVSPTSPQPLLDLPDTPATTQPQQNLQNAPSFVLKVQQKLPKPHPKVAKATSMAWTKFTTFLDRIEGDDLDNIDWQKVKQQAEAEEAREALN